MTTPRYSSVLALACALSVCFLWIEPVRAMGPKGPPEPPGQDSIRKVILMIGDGMGPEQVALARLFAPGGELAMDRVDGDPSFITTHSVFGGITDSAAAGTALATGIKTTDGAVGVDAAGNPVENVRERAEAHGKASGILTSVPIACATPASFSAHTASRSNRTDISLQQVAAGIEVLLGAGRETYLPGGCCGTGGRNLIEELIDDGYEFVTDAEELADATAPNGTLLGFFGGVTLTYALDRQQDMGNNDPTLAEMTAKAIEVLNRDPDGFFMMVEGGAIDWLCHNKDAAGCKGETLAFDEAVQVALDFANEDGETLLVVTADHETGGLTLGDDMNLACLGGITATTDYIWQSRKARMMLSPEEAMEAFASSCFPPNDPLTPDEINMMNSLGEMGISDVLSARIGVSWNGIGMDEGDHTLTKVPVFAVGPGSEKFDGPNFDNTDVGQLLLEAVSGN
jgi:alkaline phosphatase